MKKLFVAYIALIMALSVNAREKQMKNNSESGARAASSISGVVLDSVSGEQLAGVEVRIEGTETKTYTDFDGNFTFKGVVPGKYKLVTNYISYEKSTEELKIDAKDNIVKISLSNSK